MRWKEWVLVVLPITILLNVTTGVHVTTEGSPPPIKVPASEPTKPSVPTICIKAPKLHTSWKLDAAIKAWNRNGRTLLKIGKPSEASPCRSIVTIVESHNLEGDNAGQIQFTEYEHIDMKLSPKVQLKYRRDITCHELGHVLGLPHNKNSHSCMTDPALSATPTKDDLEEVARHEWDWQDASLRVHGLT